MAKKGKKSAVKEVVEELKEEGVEVEIVNEPVVKESPRLFEAPRKRR
jgi:biotin operon repressor